MRWLLLIGALALAACEDTAQDSAPDPATEFGPGFAAAQEQQCVDQGGTFSPGPKGSMVCLMETGEGTQSCTTANDCSGACLARSRTCSPIMPLLGCNEIITSDGLAITQCIE
ncbi:MAG: hypothetical protein HRU32_01130 [Rhodobacteraceae bacterium]|nr:hypothetical protein [Paracoccaceae bacterium]